MTHRRAQPPGALHHCETTSVKCELNATEWRFHFGGWAIVSAPLVLGMDVRDGDQLDAVWPVISNKEVIEVNQLWAGDAGTLVARGEPVTVPNCGQGKACSVPSWAIWKKTLPPAATGGRVRGTGSGSRVAVLLLNSDHVDRRVRVAAWLSFLLSYVALLPFSCNPFLSIWLFLYRKCFLLF